MKDEPTMLDYAISCAVRGWYPFPCRVNGKQPATRSGVYAGDNDLVVVRQRWKKPYNIGLWTGAAKLVVLDLDVDKTNSGQVAGISWWIETCERSGADPFGTYCAATAGGGMHVYFKHPEGIEIHPSVGQLSPLVDVRAAGSYVLAVGSVVNGITYEAVGEYNEPADMFDWLIEMVKYREAPEEVRARMVIMQTKLERGEVDIQKYVDIRLQRILDAWVHSRNNTLNEQAFAIFMMTPLRHHDGIEQALIDTGTMIELSRAEATATVRSARRGAERKRSFGS